MHLGGDFRAAAGATNPGNKFQEAAFPMQSELHAAATSGALSIVADLGLTVAKDGGSPLTLLMSRQHYVQWLEHETGDGWYARAGRFMPVYGLRLAEHTAYTRRFGGTPLFGETYGAAVGWTSPEAEFHLTGFAHDRLRPNVIDGDGAAAYAEKRFGRMAVGAEARYAHAADNVRTAGGVTGKLWLDGPEVLLHGEVQGVHQALDAGPARNQVIGYLMASWFPARSYLLDVGVGHYDEDVKVPEVDRNALEVNLHWFANAHIELILMTRLQTIALGQGGDTSGYGLLQFHYRL